MDCIYIALSQRYDLSKALYNYCLTFTHSYRHSDSDVGSAMQGDSQLAGSS